MTSRERMVTFAPGRRYVFGVVHNMQVLTQPANLSAPFETRKEYPKRMGKE